jgi:hypothetical protein
MSINLNKPRPTVAWALLVAFAATAAYLSTDDWLARVLVFAFLVGGPALWLKRQQKPRH